MVTYSARDLIHSKVIVAHLKVNVLLKPTDFLIRGMVDAFLILNDTQDCSIVRNKKGNSADAPCLIGLKKSGKFSRTCRRCGRKPHNFTSYSLELMWAQLKPEMSRIFRLSYVTIAAYSVGGTIARDLLLLHAGTDLPRGVSDKSCS